MIISLPPRSPQFQVAGVGGAASPLLIIKRFGWLAGVRVVAEHGESAVNLFGENGAGEFVGKCHGGEREELVGAGALVSG